MGDSAIPLLVEEMATKILTDKYISEKVMALLSMFFSKQKQFAPC